MAARRLFPFTSSTVVTAAIAIGLVAATITVGLRDDASGWLAAGFAIAPDFAFFAGIGQPVQKGQMPPRAVPFYNAAHSLIGPVVLFAGAMALGPHLSLAGAGLAWAAHIMVDRTVGYGMRSPAGFREAISGGCR